MTKKEMEAELQRITAMLVDHEMRIRALEKRAGIVPKPRPPDVQAWVAKHCPICAEEER